MIGACSSASEIYYSASSLLVTSKGIDCPAGLGKGSNILKLRFFTGLFHFLKDLS